MTKLKIFMANKAKQTVADLEMNQQLCIIKIEMDLDISIKPGDKIELIPDKELRAKIIRSLFNPHAKNLVWSVAEVNDFVEHRKHITQGVVEFVSIGVYFSGPEIRVDNTFLPLPLVKSINGKEINLFK